METRRPPLGGSEQQHHYQRPPPPPPPHNPHNPPYPTRPQSLPGVDTFHPPLTAPPLHAYPGPPPPALLHPTSHNEAQERPEHAYTAPPAVHGTPVIKPDPPPFQRPPSNPSQQPLSSSATRPQMDHQPSAYAPPPPPPPPGEHHVTYMPAPPMMEHYAQPPPGYHPGFIYPGLHMANTNNTRKKSMRASQACDKCRERKSKCDENRPCSTCKDQNIECRYKDNQPTKTDKTNAAFSDQMERMNSNIEALSEHMAVMRKEMMEMQRQNRVDTPNAYPTDRYQPDSRRESVEEPFNLGEHTTAAHKLLLLWPSIHPFIQNQKLDIKDNYVMKGEDRGLLRLYGIGERSLDDRVAIGAASPAHSHNSDEFSASPPDGPTNGFVPWDGEPRRSEPFSRDSVMMSDPETLDRLFNTYKRHIHRLHPFLDIDSVGKYLRTFIRRHCSDVKHSPMFVPNGERESKRRKRSDGFAHSAGLLQSDPNVYSSQLPRRQPERTVITAILYLVFALGKICEAADPLPGPALEISPQNGKPPAHMYTGASPITKPSPSSPHSSFNHLNSSVPSVTARASSWDGSPNLERRQVQPQVQNVDKIPGLLYYREASSILGDFSDSNELACAQARLLAGLYKGQLARVQESWSWIHSAARTCLYRMKLDGLDRQHPYGHEFSKNENLTLLAYWTCLQLESDILAEWDYPSSGLSALEDIVNWPTNVIDEEASQKMTTSRDLDSINIFYSAQLFLRKRLNQIHARLYSTALSKYGTPKALSKTLLEHDSTLGHWRQVPQPMTSWSDDDLPASDILAARLRAKYYGARYVATRPFLDFALHVMPGAARGQTLEDLTKDAQGRQRENELALFRAMYSEMDTDVIKAKCKICIESAMQSTVAFDEITKDNQRLIVTNIMGTAHAQFGNMLVLAATYNSGIDWLQALIPRLRLQPLLRRTIRFIRRLQHASNAAQIDVMILEAVEKTLFPAKDDNNIYENEHHTGDSFTT